jgi:DNA adenine methylase
VTNSGAATARHELAGGPNATSQLPQTLLPLPGLLPGPRGRPFLKWAGGKSRLLPRLLPYVPAKFANYHEPFLGGGAMFFAVRDRAAGQFYLSDLNDELMNAWLVMRDHGEELQTALRDYKAKDSEEFFYSLRPLQPNDPVERAARFFYLNQTAWNGLWRVNRRGEFNVPWGQRRFRGFTITEFQESHRILGSVRLRVQDFREALELVKPGDFVYLDPPYLPLSDTSKFYLYTEQRFREPDLRELASICERLSRQGVHWVLSNRDTRLIHELFGFARMVQLTTRRSIAAQNKRDVEAVDSPELIIVGGVLE